KWQLDGGDTSIHTFGWEKYCVWEPYITNEGRLHRYKSPVIYQDGAYLADSVTRDKYSPNIYLNYALNFIDSNLQKPFIVYYSEPLAHTPFGPTPEDPAWSGWDHSQSRIKYFSEMIEYMDKQLGVFMNNLDSLGLQQNTIMIFVGDNGTPKNIKSLFKDHIVPGEKGKTTTFGTHV